MSEHDPTPDAEPLESVDAEDAELLLVDPDDYHESQRLREIHQARREVHSQLKDIDGKTNSHFDQKTDLAQAVAAYAAELEPLMDRTDFDDSLPEHFPFDSISEFLYGLGCYNEDGEYKAAHYNISMTIFRRCNQFLADVKPVITEDSTNEWEV